MELRRPRLEDKEAVIDLILEFERSNAAHDGGFWDKENFVYEDWIAFDKGQAVGFLNLRLRLNEHLRGHGGHIGYSVRPTMQGKGYATAMLKEGLLVAASKNIHRVLVTCAEDNSASRAVILKNGGILEDIRQGTERYWIDLN